MFVMFDVVMTRLVHPLCFVGWPVVLDVSRSRQQQLQEV